MCGNAAGGRRFFFFNFKSRFLSFFSNRFLFFLGFFFGFLFFLVSYFFGFLVVFGFFVSFLAS